MTYNVFGGTLNLAQSNSCWLFPAMYGGPAHVASQLYLTIVN